MGKCIELIYNAHCLKEMQHNEETLNALQKYDVSCDYEIMKRQDEYFEDIEELEYTFEMIANSYPDARAFIDAILADDDI